MGTEGCVKAPVPERSLCWGNTRKINLHGLCSLKVKKKTKKQPKTLIFIWFLSCMYSFGSWMNEFGCIFFFSPKNICKLLNLFLKAGSLAHSLPL